MSQGAVFNDFFRLSGLVTELLAFCQDFNRCTFQARTVRSLDEIDFKSKTDLQIGADIYGPGEARDDLEQAEHVADTEASMQSRSSQCLARGSGALCRATLPVPQCGEEEMSWCKTALLHISLYLSDWPRHLIYLCCYILLHQGSQEHVPELLVFDA